MLLVLSLSLITNAIKEDKKANKLVKTWTILQLTLHLSFLKLKLSIKNGVSKLVI